MAQHVVHTQLPGQLVMLGCGSIGQAVLPLILRHLGVTPERITIVTADARGREEAAAVRHRVPRDGADAGELPAGARAAGRRRRLRAQPLGRRQQHRHRRVLPRARRALSRHRRRALGRHVFRPQPDAGRPLELRAAREHAAAAPRARPRADRGQRPGRQPRPGLAAGQGGGAAASPATPACRIAEPTDRQGWARLFRDLGVKAIHIAERDTQVSRQPKRPGEFVNTWSIDGFVSEGCQPAELGWGTHERHFPPRAGAPCRWLRRRDLPEPARGRHAGAHLDAAGGAVPRLPRHPQRVDLDRRLSDAARRRCRASTGRPCTTPITRATPPCCRCTSWPAAAGSSSPSSG